MEYLEMGKVCNVHGLKGAIKVIPWTDFPEVFEDTKTIDIDAKEYEICSVQYHKSSVILKLKGVDSVSDAEKFKNKIIRCNKKKFGKLPENTFFVADLIGCKVYENENLLGEISYVLQNGGADIYEITKEEGKPFYLPAVKENILSVDIKNKIIKVKLPEGLLE